MLTFGRSGVDIYPLQIGVGLEDVETFGKYLGGTTANVAVAAARLGRAAAIITGVGDDPFGRFVRRALRDLGVDDRLRGHQHRVRHPGRPSARSSRRTTSRSTSTASPTAPDMQVKPADIDFDAVRATAADVAVGHRPERGAEPRVATTPCWRPGPASRSPCSTWTTARCSGPSPEAARPSRCSEALPQVTVAVGNREECEVAVGETDPERAADALLAAGVELAIVKQGPKGVLAKTQTERVESAADPDHAAERAGRR